MNFGIQRLLLLSAVLQHEVQSVARCVGPVKFLESPVPKLKTFQRSVLQTSAKGLAEAHGMRSADLSMSEIRQSPKGNSQAGQGQVDSDRKAAQEA
mmetsp:Transcript_30296/g.93767  ORF Transcript_30296/g.93767 Transcript_30296/m.93767 type:complete len:96 (+) Transcript_30296:1237-1524(+)